jgi:hypothetical protein
MPAEPTDFPKPTLSRRPRFRLGRIAVVCLLFFIAGAMWFMTLRPLFEQRRFNELVARLQVRGMEVESSLEEPAWVKQYFAWTPNRVREAFRQRISAVRVRSDLTKAPVREDWEAVSRLPGLTRLGIEKGGGEFDDNCLELFRACPGLYDLVLTETRVTAAGLRRLREWPALLTVVLYNPRLTEAEEQELSAIIRPGFLVIRLPKAR